jgi:hypothetical protein
MTMDGAAVTALIKELNEANTAGKIEVGVVLLVIDLVELYHPVTC